jgi:hypothetical protein
MAAWICRKEEVDLCYGHESNLVPPGRPARNVVTTYIKTEGPQPPFVVVQSYSVTQTTVEVRMPTATRIYTANAKGA